VTPSKAKNLSELVNSAPTIATLPSVYSRLRDVIANPKSSSQDIGNLVTEDPGLTARILKLVNSAFFGFPGRIDTVSRAVTIVGTQQLSDLVLATSVIKAFDKIPQHLVDMDSFWFHSLATGVCARVIATKRHEDNIERFFVAGLLHDIGLPILYLKKPESSQKILEISKTSEKILSILEHEEYGFDHADVSQAFLQAWNLPESLQEAVHCHHDPKRAEHFPIEAYAVHAANSIVSALELGSAGEFVTPALASETFDVLEIKDDDVPSLLEDVAKQYEDIIKIFLGSSENEVKKEKADQKKK
jgi:HD-like signal output (HDOD) protein